MRYIILRDDDTNALTPVECLEQLYRPFLARGLPVNLATIPEVRANARTPTGAREGFLPTATAEPSSYAPETVPLIENRALIGYLQENRGYHIVQHGCYHDAFEFASDDRAEIVRRLERGRERLREAGFNHANVFVAPHDKLSRVACEEAARRFRVISTGWFELRQLPWRWLPRYIIKKLTRRPHWRVAQTHLLSHRGCLLSHTRPLDTMLDTIKRSTAQQQLTVIVTHWWEYFRGGVPDEDFIRVLHRVADYLASTPDLRVIPFTALVRDNDVAAAAADGATGRIATLNPAAR